MCTALPREEENTWQCSSLKSLPLLTRDGTDRLPFWHVFLVDEDVDCFDLKDVIWAMNTRMQGDADIITIPGVRCHPLDPSNNPSCSPSIRDHGIACKTIFDCTVPYDQKERFKRARFMEVDPEKWL